MHCVVSQELCSDGRLHFFGREVYNSHPEFIATIRGRRNSNHVLVARRLRKVEGAVNTKPFKLDFPRDYSGEESLFSAELDRAYAQAYKWACDDLSARG